MRLSMVLNEKAKKKSDCPAKRDHSKGMLSEKSLSAVWI